MDNSSLPKCPCWIEFERKGLYTECIHDYGMDCRDCERMKEVEHGTTESK